jgi:Cu2+-exporting ATPase/Cu+-exporting ATPase
MSGDLMRLPVFFSLAEKVGNTIRQNLILTFVYNLIAVPIAMSGLLSPIVAVCAMLMSSLSVIGNTLLFITSFQPYKGLPWNQPNPESE